VWSGKVPVIANSLNLNTSRATVLPGIQERFGQKLRKVREARGISQEKLAQLAVIHRTYVGSVERGERNISLVNIERLAKALGVRAADLMP